MARRQGLRRANGSEEIPVRSVRVAEVTWKQAVKRSAREGLTMSAVLLAFVECYAAGSVETPRFQAVMSADNAPASQL